MERRKRAFCKIYLPILGYSKKLYNVPLAALLLTPYYLLLTPYHSTTYYLITYYPTTYHGTTYDLITYYLLPYYLLLYNMYHSFSTPDRVLPPTNGA